MIEKRKSPRKTILSTCMVKRIFIKEQLIRSIIVNYSKNGVMLESDVLFRVGDAVTIYSSMEIKRKIKSNSDASVGLVRWCTKLDGLQGGFYGVGVELAL